MFPLYNRLVHVYRGPHPFFSHLYQNDNMTTCNSLPQAVLACSAQALVWSSRKGKLDAKLGAGLDQLHFYPISLFSSSFFSVEGGAICIGRLGGNIYISDKSKLLKFHGNHCDLSIIKHGSGQHYQTL